MSQPNTFLIQRKALTRFRKHIPFLALIPNAIYQRLSPEHPFAHCDPPDEEEPALPDGVVPDDIPF